MSGLSLSQIRTYVDRLGDIDDEVTRCCHVARRAAKGTKSGALEGACKELEERQEHVREAKEALLEYDAFLHSQKASIRGALDHPRLGGKAAAFFSQVDARLGPALEDHVSTLVEETVEGLRRVAAELRAVEQAAQDEHDTKSCKESVKALKKTIAAAEKTLEKALEVTSKKDDAAEDLVEEADPVPGDEVVVEDIERMASHGYTLTAKVPDFIQEKIDARSKDDGDEKEKDGDEKDGKKASDHGYVLTAGLPPEFLENAQKKKDEAAAKKKDGDEDEGKDKKASGHGYVLTADSRTPGNESKGPKEEGEEDEGWVPGHRTDGKADKKASDHGYDLNG